jgi:hypothetical protein
MGMVAGVKLVRGSELSELSTIRFLPIQPGYDSTMIEPDILLLDELIGAGAL